MKKTTLLIVMAAGMAVAEGERPFEIMNTMRFGYSDNIDRRPDGDGSAYFKDTVNFSFNAALSDRTEMILKSRLVFRSDEDNDFYPYLYSVVRHSVSPRLMLTLTEKFRSGDKTSGDKGGRRDYFINNLDLVSTYVLDQKNRLEMNVENEVRRHDSEIDSEDLTSFGAGITWSRELRPQRTTGMLSLKQTTVDYDERDSSYDATVFSAGLNHTISENWQGTLYGGATYSQTDFENQDEDSYVSPLFDLGLIYTPSPRTRLSGNFTHRYEPSENSAYGAQTSSEVRFAAQHDITARIMGKALARFQDIEYDGDDSERGGGDSDQQRIDLELKLSYKLNRLNFLEMNLKYREKEYDGGLGDWEENRVDLGWRVEL